MLLLKHKVTNKVIINCIKYIKIKKETWEATICCCIDSLTVDACCEEIFDEATICCWLCCCWINAAATAGGSVLEFSVEAVIIVDCLLTSVISPVEANNTEEECCWNPKNEYKKTSFKKYNNEVVTRKNLWNIIFCIERMTPKILKSKNSRSLDYS